MIAALVERQSQQVQCIGIAGIGLQGFAVERRRAFEVAGAVNPHGLL
jgi:hypothetical protein